MVFRVKWLDKKLQEDWDKDPKHVMEHLFVRQDGRVVWYSYEGIADITDEVEVIWTNPLDNPIIYDVDHLYEEEQ